ncbi:cilia- and flagella-associated protein 251-like isoform X2 [Ischnura elegans]|nr:cilia- and flagella-associated protein 251-like isoform X2 [Ischnura elegans]
MTRISSSGEYVISLSTEPGYTVCSLWMLHKERRNAEWTHKIFEDLGRVNDVAFSSSASMEFMLTTESTVIFFKWHYDAPKPEDPQVYIPAPLSWKYRGKLCESIYLNRHHRSMTYTSDGHVLIWNDSIHTSWKRGNTPSTWEKVLEKWIHLQKGGITCIQQWRLFVITGDSSGIIRFFNQMLFLIHCINFPGNPTNLRQVEFHLQQAADTNEKSAANLNGSTLFRNRSTYESKEAGRDLASLGISFHGSHHMDKSSKRSVHLPKDFIVVDGHGCAYLIDAINRKPYILLECESNVITCFDVHPESEIISIANRKGEISMVNYISCQYTYIKSIVEFLNSDEEVISCIKYSSLGNYIAVGMRSGELLFVDSCLYLPKMKKPFHVSRSPIAKICFSPDDSYMAHIDGQDTVTLYGSQNITKGDGPEWIYCGRVYPHSGVVNYLTFDPYPRMKNRLLSVGNDCSLVEYTLELRKREGLCILSRDRIEQSAYPLHISWIDHSSDKRYLLITNSEFKCKLYNLDTKDLRQTCLTISYDSPISCLHTLQSDSSEAMLFATSTLIGLLKLPFDGNPYKVMGVLANPVELTAVIPSQDHQTVFSLGKDETYIVKWHTNMSAMDTLCNEGGDGLKPMYCMFEDGENGWLFKQALDYFYLAQLLHEGHLWKDEHVISRAIKTCELPPIMQSLGYFATKKEIQSMLHEVMNEISIRTKRKRNEIEFEDFICLFLNHRSAKGITFNDLTKHFKTLSEGEFTIPTEKLLHVLTNSGENMSTDELKICMKILLQDGILDENHMLEENVLQLPEELTQNIIEDALLGIKNMEKEGEK